MPQSHTSTRQWQSFELRMRHRRVERCLQRAREALLKRRLREAREVLEEAQQLEPDSAEVRALVARIAAAASEPSRLRPAAWGRTVVAGITLVVAGLGGLWMAWPGGARPAEDALAAAVPPAPVARPTGDDALPSPRFAEPSLARTAESLVETDAPRPSGSAAVAPEMVVATAGENRRSGGQEGQEANRRSGGQEGQEGNRRSGGQEGQEGNRRSGGQEGQEANRRSGGQEGQEANRRPGDQEIRTAAARDVAPAIGGPPTSALAGVGAVSPSRSPAPAEPVSRPAVLAELPPAPLDLPPTVSAPAEPAPAPPPPAASAHEAVSTAAPEKLVRATLNRYQAAYSSLDAAAAGAIWPSVDTRALARAFDGLAAQTVSLGHCDVAVTGGAAVADCRGYARWTPKVGGGTQTAPRRWRFELAPVGAAWVITQAVVQ